MRCAVDFKEVAMRGRKRIGVLMVLALGVLLGAAQAYAAGARTLPYPAPIPIPVER